jgi:hypothetical protein
MHWLELLVKGPPGTPPSLVAGYWVAAFLTIAIYSFLYKDNPLYRFAESLFVGIGAAYTLALVYHNTLRPKLFLALFPPDPAVAPVWYRIVPGVLAVFMLLRFYPKLSWLSRWSLGFIVGMYSAVNITGFAQGDFVAQIHATMTTPLGHGGGLALALNIAGIIGVVATLSYFFFSREHRGALGASAKLGIWFLMVAFGASFGYTVMGRVSLLIGRMTFLLRDWLHLIR